MSVDLDEYKRLKSKVDALRRDRDRAQGALDQLMAELEDRHGCGSVEEAQDALREKRRKAGELRKRFDRAMAKFREKWKEVYDEGG